MKCYMTALASVFILSITLNFAHAGSPKCERIKQKITKAESLVEFAKYNMRPAEAANAMIGARKRAERHKQEYHNLGCDGSMPARQQMEQQVRQQMEQRARQPSMQAVPPSVNDKEICVSQCKKYTERSDEECFDACWK